jgi:HPt (histidine-containing phosphotransfer) domain-containing protein
VTLDAEAMARLLEITGGDQAFIDELVDTFVDDARTQIEGLRAAASSGDTEAVVRPAHSLKSNAQNVGATLLAELSRSLEADARAGAIADLTARIDAVEMEFGAVSAALRADRTRD